MWSRTGRSLLIPALLCLATSLTSCNRGGMLGQNSSPNGSSNSQDTKQQQSTGQKGQAQPEFTEPQASVDGKPSAASDRGSPDAVSHRSVAQPGAPQGTVNPDASSPAPGSRSAHR